MISWMQKNNKFLIVTMWIATVSFIFTGATYGFSTALRSNSIGTVGEIELKQDQFAMNYDNLFKSYEQQMQGHFDKEMAKKMNLEGRVISSMATEAKILNLAKDLGVIVTDEEVGKKLSSIPYFQTNGQFDRKIYDTFIASRPFDNQTYEESLKEQLIIEKTFSMLALDKSLDNEYKAFALAFEIADKIKYSTLSNKDVNVTVDDAKLKEFWETRKSQYKTAKQYTLDIQWTDTKDTNVTDAEVEAYYNENRFNYKDSQGKILPLNDIKNSVVADAKIKKSNKIAYKRYLKLKKGDLIKDETITLNINDPRLSQELWKEISTGKVNDLLKPKVVGEKYASVKLVNIVEPVEKTFDAVKEFITPLYKQEASKEALATLADNKLSTIDNDETNVSNFITLANAEKQKIGLNAQETSDFVSKLFTSSKEKGIIPIGSKVIVYKILEQKLITLDSNETEILHKNADLVKKQSFETSLIKKLDEMYPTKLYK